MRARFERGARARAGARRRRRDVPLPHAPHALSAYYLIAPAEARPTSPASTACATACASTATATRSRCTARTRAAGLRRRGQAPDHARHLRALQRLLRRLLREAQKARTLIAEDFAAAFERVRRSSSRRPRPCVAFELGAKTDDPLAMYLNDFCTVPMSLAGIPAISIPCGPRARGLPVGLQLAGPRVQRERAARRRARARAGDRLRRRAARQRRGPQ